MDEWYDDDRAKRARGGRAKRADGGKVDNSGYRFTPPSGSSTEDYYKAFDPTTGYERLKQMTGRSSDTGKARGGWIGKARASMEKRGTVGALHKELGVPGGKKIGSGVLATAKARAKRTGNSTLMKRVTFAQNVRGR